MLTTLAIRPPPPSQLDSKLSTYLPHAVKEDEGKARFDAATETLAVTLPIVREGGV